MSKAFPQWAEPRDDALGRRLVDIALGRDRERGREVWDEALARRAEEEKLAPLLGARLAAGEGEATPEAAARLRAAHRDTVAQELAAEASLAPLLEEFAHRGVEALAVKGLALRHTVYGSGERWMADVDLVVRQSTWLQMAAAVAAAGGWIVRSGERPLTDRLFHEIHAVLPPGFLVDVHRALHSRPLFPIVAEDLFAASTACAATPDAPGFRLPAAEDHLVILATHAAKDGYFVPLREVVDSLRLIAADADPAGLTERLAERLTERGRRWHCRRAVALWLRILLRFGLEADPWQGVVVALDPKDRTAHRAALLPQRFVGTPRRHAWTVKGRLAVLQDSPWRGGAFLLTAGVLYLVDGVLRRLPGIRAKNA